MGLGWLATSAIKLSLVRQLEMQDQERDAMIRQIGAMKENEIKAAQAAG